MKKEKSLLNITERILLQIDSSEEKDHTLSWELLKKIGDNMQDIIITLFKLSTDDKLIPSEAIKLRFSGFYEGSAVPAWQLPEAQNLLFDITPQLEKVNSNFNLIISSLNTGRFEQLNSITDNVELNNKLVDNVYNFSNSVGGKKFNFVKPSSAKKGFKTVAKIFQMPLKTKNSIYKVEDKGSTTKNSKEIEFVAKINAVKDVKGKLSKKKIVYYENKEATLALKYDSIQYKNRLYTFSNELIFSFSNPDNHCFNIENQLLDIYAFGRTHKEAEEDLFSQFDYTYKRLTQIENEKLSDHLQRAKNYILLIVNKITDL